MKKVLLTALLLISAWVGAQKKPIKVACVGNSITYGYLLENRTQDAYPAVLQRDLGKNY